MSVINQMLKDLDERQNEQQHSHTNQVPMKKPGTPWKLITLIIITVIGLNIVGIFIWQLYSENKTLKDINESSYDQNQQAQQLVKGLEKKLLNSKSEKNTASNDEALSSKYMSSKTKLSKAKSSKTKISKAEPSKEELGKNITQEDVTQQTNVQKEDAKYIEKLNAESQVNENIVREKDSGQHIAPQNLSENHSAESHIPESDTKIERAVKPTLSISRKQLTAAELTQQKINQAEQALAENKLSKAEKLFEDVLLMTPEHKAARKQLAALWFGRQSYQAAINVLSQGTQLYPDDSEFRLMKARIYLNQGQTIAAVNTLKELPYVEDVEYQALLASHAQQISQFDIAATAYQLLAKLEPTAGRWWLGLAVAYDSNSEFDQAVKAYDQAIDKSDLSENARQFARQRVQELGE